MLWSKGSQQRLGQFAVTVPESFIFVLCALVVERRKPLLLTCSCDPFLSSFQGLLMELNVFQPLIQEWLSGTLMQVVGCMRQSFSFNGF